MTLYARSDIVAVSVSPEAHGGCGKTHHRPASDGNPVPIWALDCLACEDFLRSGHSDLWAASPAKIPESPDEIANREENDKRAARDQQQIMTAALAKIAGLPEAERAMILTGVSAAPPRALESPVTCPGGHKSPAGSKFCTECGRPVAALSVVLCPGGHANAPGSKFCTECGHALQAILAAPPVSPIPPVPVAGPAVVAPEAGAGLDVQLMGHRFDEHPPETPSGDPAPVKPAEPDLATVHFKTLQKMCRGAGVKDTGTRRDLARRLQQARKEAQAASAREAAMPGFPGPGSHRSM